MRLKLTNMHTRLEAFIMLSSLISFRMTAIPVKMLRASEMVVAAKYLLRRGSARAAGRRPSTRQIKISKIITSRL